MKEAMVDYLNGLQPQTALALVQRAVRPDRGGPAVAAPDGGGAAGHDPRRREREGQALHPPPEPPTEPPTGPPPAFEANVLEAEARSRHDGLRLLPDEADRQEPERRGGSRPEGWRSPVVPDPALIDQQV